MMTQTRLKELLDYDLSTGLFTWRVARGSVKAGTIIVNRNKISGYSQIKIDRKMYQAHRLVWLYMYGSFPSNNIDHINRIKDDNRICNLRDITQQENTFNREVQGYCYHKRIGKYQANISINYKKIHLGYYNTTQEAHNAYLEAKEKLHIIKE